MRSPGYLGFQLLQPLGLVGLYPAEVLTSAAVGLVGDTQLFTGLRYSFTVCIQHISFAELVNDLFWVASFL